MSNLAKKECCLSDVNVHTRFATHCCLNVPVDSRFLRIYLVTHSYVRIKLLKLNFIHDSRHDVSVMFWEVAVTSSVLQALSSVVEITAYTVPYMSANHNPADIHIFSSTV